MNNDNRRNQKPDGSPVKLVIAVIVALLVLSDAVGIGGGTVLFIVLMIGAVVLAVIAMKKAQADAADKNSESDAAQPARTEPAKREFKPEHFDVSKFVGKGESISKRLTEKMRDDLTRCDDDHEHVEPDYHGTDEEKRASQLKELLRNGLIEKDEYNILMRKYGLKKKKKRLRYTPTARAPATRVRVAGARFCAMAARKRRCPAAKSRQQTIAWS